MVLTQGATTEAVSQPGTHRVLALAVFAMVLAIDIATKVWAAAVLTEPVRITDWLYLMLRYNSGSFFGTVPASAGYWVCVLAAMGWFGWLALRLRNAVPAAFLAVALAGLMGNAIGQARGAVVDFIGVGPVTGNKWLVANVADLALVGGGLALGVYLVRQRMRPADSTAIKAKLDHGRPGAGS